jgi:hypothetical protein
MNLSGVKSRLRALEKSLQAQVMNDNRTLFWVYSQAEYDQLPPMGENERRITILADLSTADKVSTIAEEILAVSRELKADGVTLREVKSVVTDLPGFVERVFEAKEEKDEA